MSLAIAFLKVLVVVLLVISLGFVGLIYVSFCPSINTSLLNKALFHPTKARAYKNSLYEVGNLIGTDVTFRFSQNSPSLHGIFYRHPNSEIVTIVNHGNGGNINASRPIADALLLAKSSVLIYDYRGYGRSAGKPSVPGVIDDARAAYNFVLNKLHYKSNSILLYGASLGSGVTSELAKEKKCIGIIYDSPFLSPERLAKETMTFFNVYPSFLWFKPSLSNSDYVRGNHPPLLIVSAKYDKTIPVSHSKRLYKLASGAKSMRIFEHSQHTWFKNDEIEYRKAIKEFVSNFTNMTAARQSLAAS